jgi:hypothetical protein
MHLTEMGQRLSDQQIFDLVTKCDTNFNHVLGMLNTFPARSGICACIVDMALQLERYTSHTCTPPWRVSNPQNSANFFGSLKSKKVLRLPPAMMPISVRCQRQIQYFERQS